MDTIFVDRCVLYMTMQFLPTEVIPCKAVTVVCTQWVKATDKRPKTYFILSDDIGSAFKSGSFLRVFLIFHLNIVHCKVLSLKKKDKKNPAYGRH